MSRERRSKPVAMPTWKQEYKTMMQTKEGQVRLLQLSEFIVDTIDEAIESGEVWFNLGLGKRSHNPQLTLHDAKDTWYASGVTLDEFLRELESL
jgi:hypothetical protein